MGTARPQRPVRYPTQLVVMVRQETGEQIEQRAHEGELPKSEVAREAIELGLELARVRPSVLARVLEDADRPDAPGLGVILEAYLELGIVEHDRLVAQRKTNPTQ